MPPLLLPTLDERLTLPHFILVGLPEIARTPRPCNLMWTGLDRIAWRMSKFYIQSRSGVPYWLCIASWNIIQNSFQGTSPLSLMIYYWKICSCTHGISIGAFNFCNVDYIWTFLVFSSAFSVTYNGIIFAGLNMDLHACPCKVPWVYALEELGQEVV